MKVDADLIAKNLADFDQDSDREFEEKFSLPESLESRAEKPSKAVLKKGEQGTEIKEKRSVKWAEKSKAQPIATKNVAEQLSALVAEAQAKERPKAPVTDFKALAYEAYSTQFAHLPSYEDAKAMQAKEEADLQNGEADQFVSLFEESDSPEVPLPEYFYDDEEFDELWRYWRERGMNFLVRREHSITELSQKLLQRKCPPWLIDFLVGWYVEQNYLSLERFAYSYAKNRADLGYGPIRVRYELNQHEVPGRYITQAFKEIDWQEARARAERKIRQTDPQKRRQALFRRGFKTDSTSVW